MLKSNSVIRSKGIHSVSSLCGWKFPSVVCALILLSSCSKSGGSSGGVTSGGNSGGVTGGVTATTAPSAPSGLFRQSPSSAFGTDSTPTLTVSGVVSGDTVKIFTDSICSSEKGSATASSSIVNVTSSALSLGSYTFYANSTNTHGSSTCSALNVDYTFGSIPSAPTSLSLMTPGRSPGLDSTPTISVGEVVGGNTVKLFSDSSCTSEIGSATANGTSVNVTVSSSLTVSSHTIYSNASNSYGASPCSSVFASYILASCPAGFIPVPHDSSVGTDSDFCVMKYEAKNNGSGVAVSQATGNPYTSINIENSQTKCTALNTQYEVANKYDLISNPEWMTIARNAESVSSNFQAGAMARGWAAATWWGDTWANTAVALSTDSNCLYNTGANICAASGSHLYRRTLTLTNSEEIWDLSGNVAEWVDWNPVTTGPQSGPTNCSGSYVEFTALPSEACYTGRSLSANQVLPATSNGSSLEAFGRFFGGSEGAAVRGGDWFAGNTAGAFSLNLSNPATNTYTSVGFRCVYRP